MVSGVQGGGHGSRMHVFLGSFFALWVIDSFLLSHRRLLVAVFESLSCIWFFLCAPLSSMSTIGCVVKSSMQSATWGKLSWNYSNNRVTEDILSKTMTIPQPSPRLDFRMGGVLGREGYVDKKCGDRQGHSWVRYTKACPARGSS